MGNLKRQGLSIRRWLSWLERAMAICASGVTFLLIIVITSNVVLRYLAVPFPGVMELSKLLMSVVVFFPLAYVQLRGANIMVDIIVKQLSLRAQFFTNFIITTATHI